MAQSDFITYRDKRIYSLDFRGTKTKEESLALVEAARATVPLQPPTSVLILTDTTDSYTNDAVVNELKALAKANAVAVRAGAAVGVTGVRKLLFEAILRFSGRNIRVFETREKALDWLVSQ